MKKKGGVTPRDVLGVYWRYAMRRKWSLLFIGLFTGGAVTADALAPLALKQLFDVFGGTPSDPGAAGAIMAALLFLLATRATAWLLWRLGGFINIYFQPRSMADIEIDSFTYILGHSYQFFADNFAGSLVKKVGRLTRAFERFADEIIYHWIPIIVVLTGAIFGLYGQYPLLAFIFIGWFILVFIFSVFAAMWATKVDIERAEADSELGGRLADTFSNAITVKVFASFTREVEKFKEVAWRVARLQTRTWGRYEVISMVQASLSITIEIALLYVGTQLWLQGVLSVGDLVFIQAYLGLVFHQVWQMSRSLRHIFDAYADGKEMVEVLHLRHEVRDVARAKELIIKKPSIKFDQVTFGFDRRPVLDALSLAIKPKEKVALVGPSGAGKTTITKLLFRFYNIRKGTISIDGQDIAKVTQDSLHRAVSLVPQDPILFHRSLRENIKYGNPDATDEEMIAAAEKAHCHEFIAKLPQGYDTFVGERGIKLSGGERQRVVIARSILENAPILVLDEATSALDSESEALIQEALKELMKDKTVIAIAHRLSTIMNMDRIIVVEAGKVVAQGTHTDLLKKEGVYRKLWSLQAGSFLEE